MSVFAGVLGQDRAVATFAAALREARRSSSSTEVAPSANGEPTSASARRQDMTHTWLITGPPGSGRSTIAQAFAAALVCPNGGCGTCDSCVAAEHHAHVDIESVVPDGIIYPIEQVRALIRRGTISPSGSAWHVIVVEDVDRFGELGAETLLKSLEEPPEHTVWLLCAPSLDDVLPTIASRCRHVRLDTPTVADVANTLIQTYGVDPAMAAFAARAGQGHIGWARALATDENARMRRQQVLSVPTQLNDLPSCFALAGELLANGQERADTITAPLDAKELSALMLAYGEGGEGKGIGTVGRRSKPAVKELERNQKRRGRRVLRDQLDRALVDLVGFYRDVLVVQTGAPVELLNDQMGLQVRQLAAASTPEDTIRRIDIITTARNQLTNDTAPILALESLMVGLKVPRSA